MSCRLVALAFAMAAAVAGLAAQTPSSPTPSSPAEVEAFSTALESCSAARAATPHPLMRSFVIEHTVTRENAGKCDYRQTMPGRMTMICGLSVEGRRQLAAEMRNMAAGGPMRGSTAAAPPQWMKECEIETASGQRSPAVGKGGGSADALTPTTVN